MLPNPLFPSPLNGLNIAPALTGFVAARNIRERLSVTGLRIFFIFFTPYDELIRDILGLFTWDTILWGPHECEMSQEINTHCERCHMVVQF